MNLNGAGLWSPIVIITAATVPTAPPEPAYSSSNDTHIVLTLSRAADDGGLPVSNYELEIDTGSSGTALAEATQSSWAKIAQYDYATDGLSFAVPAAALSLTAGNLYRFRYRAVNLMGNSPYSDTVRLGLGSLPSTVAGLARATTGSNNTSVSVSWTPLSS